MAADEQELEEALYLGENYRNQLSAIGEQHSMLQQMLEELERGKDTLEALRDVDEGEEVLLPVGAGAFVHASLTRADKVLLNLGSEVHMESGIDAAQEHVANRIESVTGAVERLEGESKRLQQEMARLNQRIEQLYAQGQGQGQGPGGPMGGGAGPGPGAGPGAPGQGE